MGDLTKRALSQALGELLEEKPLDKITISSITDRCGLTRNTFYYHFEDIYDLLRWEFERQSDKIMKEIEADCSAESFLNGLNYLYSRKKAIYHIYNSISRSSLEKYIRDIAKKYAGAIVDRLLGSPAANTDARAIVADFYTNAFVGSIEQWLDYRMSTSPEVMSILCEEMLTGTIESAAKSARKVILDPRIRPGM